MPLPFGWYAVSYSDELAVGQSKPLNYFGKEMVLFRTEEGKAVVLDAYCPHMGAHLGYGINQEAGQGGRIEGETIVCPFHAWKIGGDGIVKEIPYAKNIPPKVKDKPCIKAYHVVEENQAIWVWYHPDENQEPLWQVEVNEEANDPDWAPFEKHEWIIKTHPQEMGENSADPAHFRYVHGVANFPVWETEQIGHKVHGVQRADMETPRGTIKGEIHTNNSGPGQTWTRFKGIAETYLQGMITPIDRHTVHVRFAFSQPLKNGEVPKGGVEAAIIQDICKQLREDTPIWENKIYRPLPVLCDGDGPIAKFRKWYAQFYADFDGKI
jgi:phenylpropionate dioxygenase-like ring-hydroxylating dioxygenase large terminal subunit